MSSSGKSKGNRKRKTIASSKGSKHTLWQSNRRFKKLEINLSDMKISTTQVDAISCINSSCSCIPPCVQRIFMNNKGEVDFNQAVSFLQEARNGYAELHDDDKETFLISKFKESIQNIDE